MFGSQLQKTLNQKQRTPPGMKLICTDFVWAVKPVFSRRIDRKWTLNSCTLNFDPPQGIERSAAIKNKSAHGEPVEPLEWDPFLVSIRESHIPRGLKKGNKKNSHSNVCAS